MEKPEELNAKKTQEEDLLVVELTAEEFKEGLVILLSTGCPILVAIVGYLGY